MTLDNNIEKVAEAICNADSTMTYAEFIRAYGINCNQVERCRKLAIAAIDADSRFPGGSREVRTLRWKLKTLGKQLGKAGHTIHQLRAEVQYAYTAVSIEPRAYHANLERMRAAEALVTELRRQIKELENPETTNER